MNLVILLYYTVLTRIETSESKVERGLNCIVFAALPTSPNFSRQYFITQNIIFQGHKKWLMTQMEKSTIGSQNWAFLLSNSEFLFSIFGCQGPFSRRSHTLIPSLEGCFTCAVFNIIIRSKKLHPPIILINDRFGF